MPHVSKQKLNTKVVKELESHIRSVITDSGNRQRALIFEELLTQTEKIMLAKRLGVLLLLRKECSLYMISEILGISPSTAERYKLDFDNGKYRHTVNWIFKHQNKGSLDDLMEKLVALAFTGKTKSFKRFVEEF